MKKYFYLFSLLLILSANIAAQYKIDLSDRDYPMLEKLNLGNPGPKNKSIEVNNLYMTIGEQPVLPVMGEFHYTRYNHNFWKDTLLKMKASGVNIVSSYILWNFHEDIEGQLNWSGNNNLREFVKLCQEVGLLVHLRVGPYCNAEVRNGGFPDWIKQKDVKIRSNDPLYLKYVRKWYRDVFNQIQGLQYKDGGPIMGLQLENEYVAQGMVIPHLTTLKKIAVEEGWDVPIYSMTHWMDSDYPQGEIVPYAGYYIETPWISSGKAELPISNFQYFSYNRISDNIGTDIIKKKGNTETLIGEENSSPYFTCEVGVGTPTFYYRRAIVPKELAGANINLRLGCGVNLMGYYMYVGGTNQVGAKTTLQSSSSGPVSYDYQAPIREFGELGKSMIETKKFNFLMNDFGERMAPAVAYLPSSNNNTKNLQWAVRLNKENDGFLFVSNYLYRHDRKDYKNVQFTVNLGSETIKLPSKPMTVLNGEYFVWPLNQTIHGIQLKYATVQPICVHKSNNIDTYFFFANEGIPAEYMIDNENIKTIDNPFSTNKKKNSTLLSNIKPGIDSTIEITDTKGQKIRLITLTKDQSDLIWKGSVKGKDAVVLTKSGVIFNEGLELFGEDNNQSMLVYESDITSTKGIKKGLFTEYSFNDKKNNLHAEVIRLNPLNDAYWITDNSTHSVEKTFDGSSLSKGKEVILRMASDEPVRGKFNSQDIEFIDKGTYKEANLTPLFKSDKNTIIFNGESKFKVVASFTVKYENGKRLVWNTDGTWQNSAKKPVTELETNDIKWNGQEHVAYYQVNTPALHALWPEVRLKVDFTADNLMAYINGELVNDKLFDGENWIFGLNRYYNELLAYPLILELKGFDIEEPQIYFEKGTDLNELTHPVIKHTKVNTEYRFIAQ